MDLHYIAQATTELLGTSDPLASASQIAGNKYIYIPSFPAKSCKFLIFWGATFTSKSIIKPIEWEQVYYVIIRNPKFEMLFHVQLTYFRLLLCVCVCVCKFMFIDVYIHACVYMHVEARDQPWVSFIRIHHPSWLFYFLSLHFLLCPPFPS